MAIYRVESPEEIIKKIIDNTPSTCFIVFNHLLLRHLPANIQSTFYIPSQEVMDECKNMSITYEIFMSNLRSIIISGKQNGWKISKDHLGTIECQMIDIPQNYEENITNTI